MKGIVTKYLNERIQAPNLEAGNLVYYEPGDKVEIIDIVNGQEYEGNKVWYKLDNGSFVWSGGIDGNSVIDFELPSNPNSEENEDEILLPANDDDIYRPYPGTGKGIGVAILDSGKKTDHVYLSGRVKFYESFIKGKSLTNIHMHGQNVAGIIASDQASIKRNISDLYCFRVSSRGNNVQEQAILDSLQRIESSETLLNSIDIINMSISISSDKDYMKFYLPKIQVFIDRLMNRGILAVVAGGEDGSLNSLANLNNIIKVGAFKGKEVNGLNNYHVFFYNKTILTYSLIGNELNTDFGDDSAYTAFASGIIARLIETKKLKKDGARYSSVLSSIASIAMQYNQNSEIKPLKPFRI